MLKRTALYDWHKKSGAKLTEFGGWEMPLQYRSIVEEHHAVRKSVGIFDTSHMGQFLVEGKEALSFLQKVCTNDISRCGTNQAIYSHLCNERGGVVDDIFVYCLESASRYLVVVNAATTEKDFQWMLQNINAETRIKNLSSELSMVAVQGPDAVKVISKLHTKVPGRHECVEESSGNKNFWICRTGYTGEDGFEIIAPNSIIQEVVNAVMHTGKEWNIIPCGLGARDTLRLESGYLLYGNDVDDERTPLEAGVAWVVRFQKGDFIGKEALDRQKNSGVKEKLAAFKLSQRGIPRHGSKIFCDGKEAGTVTSGTFSPSLRTGIAMGYVPADLTGSFSIECHNKWVPAEKTKLPFYPKKKD